MSRHYARLLDAGTFLCAFILTGAVIRREFLSRRPLPGSGSTTVSAATWDSLQSAGHRIGSVSAPITIVEFSDFQCPYCARFAQEVLGPALMRYPGAFSLIYRHWPLSVHRDATAAAIASECAAAQGRFEPYHDALFKYQDSIGHWPFERFARRAGVVSPGEFTRCLSSERVAAIVEGDRQTALRLGARGTPTFIVNGLVLSGALDSARLDSIVRATRR
jgi:protein-disulfide isomerase